MIPHTDHPVAAGMRDLYRRLPVLQKLSRAGIYAIRESLAFGITRDRRWLKATELNARLHLRRQVPDPELRARLTPDYEIFCKRIILSSRWYPAIQAPNVDLVGSGIAEVREHSVVDGDGVEREIDTLIFATGFKPAELRIAERIRGRDGSSLAEVWEGSPQAYLGTTVTGFPNLLFFYGPNLNLGHSSIVYMLESQFAYALDALHTMRLRGAAEFEVLPGGPAGVQRGGSGAPGRQRLEHRRLRQLVLRPQRPQLDPVARLHVRVPTPYAPLRRRELPARGAGRRSRRRYITCAVAAAGRPRPSRRCRPGLPWADAPAHRTGTCSCQTRDAPRRSRWSPRCQRWS